MLRQKLLCKNCYVPRLRVGAGERNKELPEGARVFALERAIVLCRFGILRGEFAAGSSACDRCSLS